MGRLIDEDDVIALLVNHHFDKDKENLDLFIHDLCKEVRNIPAAYDVDSVVEQLEKEKNPLYREDGSLMGERTVIKIDKAIEIVKGGGVDAN